MKKQKNDVIINFASKASGTIVGAASVSNDWINQLKTYRNVELTDGDTALIWIWTIAMYTELLLARVEDILDSKELALLESEMLNWNVKGVTNLGLEHTKDKNLLEERKVFITETLEEVIKRARGERGKNNRTIPEIYNDFFLNSHTFGKKIPPDILSDYLVSQIESFEARNLRNELWNKLRLLDS